MTRASEPAQRRRLITVWDAARRLGVSGHQVLFWIEQERLEGFRVGGSRQRYVDPEQLDALRTELRLPEVLPRTGTPPEEMGTGSPPPPPGPGAAGPGDSGNSIAANEGADAKVRLARAPSAEAGPKARRRGSPEGAAATRVLLESSREIRRLAEVLEDVRAELAAAERRLRIAEKRSSSDLVAARSAQARIAVLEEELKKERARLSRSGASLSVEEVDELNLERRKLVSELHAAQDGKRLLEAELDRVLTRAAAVESELKRYRAQQKRKDSP